MFSPNHFDQRDLGVSGGFRNTKKSGENCTEKYFFKVMDNT